MAWIVVGSVDPSAIGLTLALNLSDWLLTALLAAGAGLAALTYRRWLWQPKVAPDRSALTLELPFFGLINPVAEELFFRGGALFGLASLMGMPWAIVVTSIVFGVHHALVRFPISFLVLGTMGGALFGITTAHFGSIAPAIVIHAVADLAVFVAPGLIAGRYWSDDNWPTVTPPSIDRLAAPTP
jgi:membrane protease YdiL (CAAX protease family)